MAIETRKDIIRRLDNALDDWCIRCHDLSEFACDNCIVRHFDAWLEEKRIEEENKE